jgi:hypothetical protein
MLKSESEKLFLDTVYFWLLSTSIFILLTQLGLSPFRPWDILNYLIPFDGAMSLALFSLLLPANFRTLMRYSALLATVTIVATIQSGFLKYVALPQ